jgi:hypothetical protein
VAPLAPTGPRVGGPAPAVEARTVAAGELDTLVIRQPLACAGQDPAGGRRDAGLAVVVTVSPARTTSGAAGGPTSGALPVTALPVGRLATPDGACRAVATDLPASYLNAVGVESVALTPTSATLQVTGLPVAGHVVGVYADGWILPLTGSQDVPGRPGAQTVRLDAATPSCDDDGVRGVVPVGLQLRLFGGGTMGTVYAPVGPSLARWLMDGRLAGCDGAPLAYPAPSGG